MLLFQGCIAEQNIEHSCSLKHDASLHDDHVRVSSTSSPSSSHRHPHQHSHHHHQKQLASSSPSSSPSSCASHQNRSPSSSSPDPHHHKQHHDHHSRSPNSRGADRDDNDKDRYDGNEPHQSTTNHQPHETSHRGVDSPSRPQTSGSHLRDQQQHPSSPSSSKDFQTRQRDHHRHPQETVHSDTNNAISESPTMSARAENEDNVESTAQAPQAAASGPGRNTWPRKRARAALPHVANLFTPEDSEQHDQASEAKPAGKMGAMYFVAFDDSICNGSDGGIGSSEVKRRPRNSQGPLPAGEYSKTELKLKIWTLN